MQTELENEVYNRSLISSRFLQRPQNAKSQDQLIYMWLTRTNRETAVQDPESQTVRRWFVGFGGMGKRIWFA